VETISKLASGEFPFIYSLTQIKVLFIAHNSSLGGEQRQTQKPVGVSTDCGTLSFYFIFLTQMNQQFY
jgi:hypothetical protein